MKKNTFKWLINLILFIGFILAFYLDLTGLSFHQWLGVSLAGFALVHLLQHGQWVKTVMQKFSDLGGRTQLNLLVDAAVMFGLLLITLTGLILSTWLNLTLVNYDTWRILHIAFSVETLLAVLVKVGLHWKMIVVQIKKSLRRQVPTKVLPVPVAVQINQPVPQSGSGKQVSRRDFLVMMGSATLVSTLTIAHILHSEETVALAQTTSAAASTAAPTTTQAAAIEEAPTQAAVVEPTSVTAQPTAIPQPTVQVVNDPACTVLCHRGCSFPGHCRRYTDSNGNNKCDLGECL